MYGNNLNWTGDESLITCSGDTRWCSNSSAYQNLSLQQVIFSNCCLVSKCINLEFPSNAVTKTVDCCTSIYNMQGHAEGLKYHSILTVTVRVTVNVSVTVTGRVILTRAGRA